jgi:hypothetical protein
MSINTPLVSLKQQHGPILHSRLQFFVSALVTMKFSYLFAPAFVPAILGQVMSVQLHPNTDNTKCLDVRGDVRANGTHVQMYVRQ